MKRTFPAAAAALILSLGATLLAAPAAHKRVFGVMPNGQKIWIYTLSNGHGMKAQVMTYGATLVTLDVPDAHGHSGDVILGLNTLHQYLTESPYFGATIGRYANRIGNHARFRLDGHLYQLHAWPPSEHGNILHGGVGFDKRVWTVKHADGNSIALFYHSPNGQQGFPGDLNTTVRFTLLPNNSLRINYRATTDKDTVINLTNHSYFNLNGQGNGTILGQMLKVNASRYTPTDADLIPTGKIASVTGTPMDFRHFTAIGARIHEKFPALIYGKGYDVNLILNPHSAHTPVAIAYSKQSGRELEVYTNQPGIQLYTSNAFNGSLHGRDGKPYLLHAAFTLETQHYPDAPNHPNFPSTELKPGQVFRSYTIYHFGIWKKK